MTTINVDGQSLEVPDDPMATMDTQTKIIWLHKQVEHYMAWEIKQLKKEIRLLEDHGNWISDELNKLKDEIKSKKS